MFMRSKYAIKSTRANYGPRMQQSLKNSVISSGRIFDHGEEISILYKRDRTSSLPHLHTSTTQHHNKKKNTTLTCIKRYYQGFITVAMNATEHLPSMSRSCQLPPPHYFLSIKQRCESRSGG
ncbi:hypothetical protein E2C01_064574 [Portunus trituberculatus]|uniref:Uncharacterized protein n=1 Tax=Portunus trituberculatus TaxID=210409 RepID=A0A5B7HDD9_PORTR|nr:hypothetical protein [Portunus trituberculatus]